MLCTLFRQKGIKELPEQSKTKHKKGDITMIRNKKFLEELRKITNSDVLALEVARLIERWEQEERAERLMCQKKGIMNAKERGTKFGRPRIEEPGNFNVICQHFLNGEINAAVAAETCGMGLSTFYRRIKKFKEERGKRGED